MASRRNYLTIAELEEYANITVTDNTEAEDQITQAEEIIDSYVGPQLKAYQTQLFGKATGGTTSTLNLQLEHVNLQTDIDYYKYCQIEIIEGTGAGQRRTISSSTKAGVITVQTAFTTAPDSTSFYKITQLGKFPRYSDTRYFTDSQPYRYLKTIPEAVKRATAAQVEYMINMGAEFFGTDRADKVSESIGDYSYSNAQGESGSAGLAKLIAPKTKILLRGIKNRTGEIINV